MKSRKKKLSYQLSSLVAALLAVVAGGKAANVSQEALQPKSYTIAQVQDEARIGKPVRSDAGLDEYRPEYFNIISTALSSTDEFDTEDPFEDEFFAKFYTFLEDSLEDESKLSDWREITVTTPVSEVANILSSNEEVISNIITSLMRAALDNQRTDIDEIVDFFEKFWAATIEQLTSPDELGKQFANTFVKTLIFAPTIGGALGLLQAIIKKIQELMSSPEEVGVEHPHHDLMPYIAINALSQIDETIEKICFCLLQHAAMRIEQLEKCTKISQESLKLALEPLEALNVVHQLTSKAYMLVPHLSEQDPLQPL